MEKKEYSRKCEILYNAMALAYAMKPKNHSFEKVRDANLQNYERQLEFGKITEEEYEFLKKENIYVYNRIVHRIK